MPSTVRRTPRRRLKRPALSARWRKLLGLIPGYDPIATAPSGTYFDEAAADLFCGFFPDVLTHVKGKLGGQPFELPPWLQAVTGCIFGWKTPEGLRRYREVFVYVPRKNAKTSWAAGVVLAVMILDDEPGMELYSGASDKEQAALCYQYAYGMVLQEPELKHRIKVYTATKTFELLEKFAYYKVLSKLPDSKHGLNVHFAAIDETHAHKSSELIDVISTGTGSRTQPLIVHTTTADWLRESVCNEKYDYACHVRDGVLDDPAFLPVIYEAKVPKEPEKDPLWWIHEDVWQQANPNYGSSVDPEYLRRECQRARDVPRYRNTFLRLHLNVRTGQDTVWFGVEAWDACYDSRLDPEALRGQPCYAGLDLASTSDLCAFVLWFPLQQAVLPYFWLPHATIDKRTEKSNVPYALWVTQMHIRVTPGNTTDYDRIRLDITTSAEARKILALSRGCAITDIPEADLEPFLCLGDRYNIKEIAIDRWNSTQLQTQLAGDGFEIVPYGQGFASMAAPCLELERLITATSLRHDGNPVMRWMASHLATEEDAVGNMKPSKARSSEKIDGFTSLIMAIGRGLVEPPAPAGSVYESRGPLIL